MLSNCLNCRIINRNKKRQACKEKYRKTNAFIKICSVR